MAKESEEEGGECKGSRSIFRNAGLACPDLYSYLLNLEVTVRRVLHRPLLV